MMLDTTRDLTVRLAALSTAAEDRVPSGLFGKAHDAFEAITTTEARHVELALENPRFGFEEAQAELAGCRRSFVRIVRELSERHRALLSHEDLARLDELAFLCERAP